MSNHQNADSLIEQSHSTIQLVFASEVSDFDQFALLVWARLRRGHVQESFYGPALL
jgi:hypothetical protein